jgi:hypothetical protein
MKKKLKISRESEISEGFSKTYHSNSRNKNLGFENIHISYGNHLFKDGKKKKTEKSRKKSKSKSKKKSRKASIKRKSSLKNKFKEVWQEKENKNKFRPNDTLLSINIYFYNW